MTQDELTKIITQQIETIENLTATVFKQTELLKQYRVICKHQQAILTDLTGVKLDIEPARGTDV